MTDWTASDVPDQSGRTALVTGANSGLGFATSVGLARAGARVLLACRDTERGEAALARLRAEVPAAAGTSAELVPLDLASLASVRATAADVAGRIDRLDALVCNAGVMAVPRRTTADGFEMQLGTNHLGHFALTGLLLPLLRVSAEPRVVVVASEAAKIGRIRFDDLMGERHYFRWTAYGQSKLANLLFARELGHRASDLTVACAHPGYAATNLQTAPGIPGRIMALGNRVVAQSEADGALPQLYAVSMPDVVSGDYYGPSRLFGMRGSPHKVSAPPAAKDDHVAARLWTVSEDLTDVRYP